MTAASADKRQRPAAAVGGPGQQSTTATPLVPAMISHYAAYLATKAHATPDTSVNGNQAHLCLEVGKKSLVIIFAAV